MAREAGDYALLVGIEAYPRYRSLSGPHDDVTAMEEWLLDGAVGGGLDRGNVRTVLSQANPPTPVQPRIDDALNELFEAVDAAGGGRRLYIYFSGHGIGTRHDEVNLCLANWSLTFRNAALRSSDYSELVRDSGHFSEVVFLLDCCRVRKIGAPGLGPMLGFAQPAGRQSRVFVGFATDYQNPAYEADEGANGGDAGPRGYFTTAFLDAVWGAAARPEGGVLASRLKDYLELQTPRLASADGYVQQPEILNGLPGGATEPVFGLSRPLIAVEIRFKPERSGHVILRGPDAAIVREGDVDSGPWRLELAPGLYAVEDAAGNTEYLRVNKPREAAVVEL